MIQEEHALHATAIGCGCMSCSPLSPVFASYLSMYALLLIHISRELTRPSPCSIYKSPLGGHRPLLPLYTPTAHIPPSPVLLSPLTRPLATMPAKKRCQLQSEPRCNQAVLRLVGQCPHCRLEFCSTHRMPEHHECQNLESYGDGMTCPPTPHAHAAPSALVSAQPPHRVVGPAGQATATRIISTSVSCS
ncbi:hypothetical protein VTO73DRAFT_3036 [Trametes versicolor]